MCLVSVSSMSRAASPLGSLRPDVAIERRHGARFPIDAEGAAALEHARDEGGIQHARHVARQVEVLLELRLAVARRARRRTRVIGAPLNERAGSSNT